jgi:IS5 family transposase
MYKDPLMQLANTINWTVFDDAFEQHYSQDNGRPSKPIRLMVGLLLLKQLENQTFNAYTLPKVHQLGGITRHTWHIV